MEIEKSESGVDGGFKEASLAYGERWGKELPGAENLRLTEKAVLGDASTTMPNFRPAELIVALMASAQFPEVKMNSIVIKGGTVGEYQESLSSIGIETQELNIEKSAWENFYASIPFIDRVQSSVVPFGRMVGKGAAIEYRRGIVRSLGEILGIISPDVKIEFFGTDIPLDQISINGGRAIGKFPCPVCSHQNKGQVTYHVLRKDESGFITTREKSKGVVSCKGAKAFLGNVSMPLGDIIDITGFIPSGPIIYKALKAELNGAGVLVRDYSNSRRTMEKMISKWPDEKVWVTTRVYVVDSQTGQDASMPVFIKSINENKEEWRSFIHNTPLISDGRVVTVKI